jgi:hypothetical protein
LPEDLGDDRMDEGRVVGSTAPKAGSSQGDRPDLRGWTTPENADTYQRIVSQEVLPGIAARNLDGYHGAYLLRRAGVRHHPAVRLPGARPRVRR